MVNNKIGPENLNQSVNGKLTGYLAFCLMIASFGASFQFGWSLSVLNNSSEVLQEFFKNVNQKRNPNSTSKFDIDGLWAVTNAQLAIGAMIGSLASGHLADLFGRKLSLILTNIFVLIGCILFSISKYIHCYETIIVGRFVTGIYCGLFSGLLPLYLSELSPRNLEGADGVLHQLMIVTGKLTASILGLTALLGSESRWPILLMIPLVPAFVHLLLVFAPESPKHLYINLNKLIEARDVLMRLRGTHHALVVDHELKSLQTEKQVLSKQRNVRWIEFLHNKHLRRPLIVAVVIMAGHQLCGINAITFYSTQIFKNVGLQGKWPTYSTILLGIVQVSITALCLLMIEKAGRKPLLLIGFVGLSLSSFGFAFARIFGKNIDWLNYLTVLFAVLYQVSYSIGPGAIPWLLTNELFNSEARAKASGLAAFTNWFTTLIISVSFPYIESYIKEYSFLVFGFGIIFIIIFILLFLPETKGKSIDQIVSDFDKQYIFLYESKQKENNI